MRGIWCLICCFEPILSDSLLTGGYPIIPLSQPLIFPSEHISDILTDSESLSGELYWLQVRSRGVSDHAQERKKLCGCEGLVLIRHSGSLYQTPQSEILVNYCPLVFISLVCLRFFGLTHLHSKLLLTADVDPLF